MGRTKAPKGCGGCIHVSYEGGCDYLLHTGHSRGCPAGEGCTVKDTGQRWAWSWDLPPRPEDGAPYHRASSVYALENDETALRLYAAGASDPEIADATGWGVTTVRNWRRRTGREANPRKGRKETHGSKSDDPAGGSG